MQIWVDADGCPKAVKDILFRAADRVRVPVTLVSNLPLRAPRSPYVKAIQVPGGFDVADHEIVRQLQPGDLVITGDIPLAAEVIENGGHALNPRGQLYTKDNIGERLAVRNLMDQLRSDGVDTGGPSSFSQSDRRAFASELDRFLAKHCITSEAQLPRSPDSPA